jgi:hypothetical protein
MDLKLRSLPNIVKLISVGFTLLALTAVSTQALAGRLHHPKGRTLAVRFIGTATMTALSWEKWPAVLQEKLPNGAKCFRVPMFDVTGSIRRGTGINCLSDQIDYGDAITVLNTVFFKMPGGVIVSQGRITAQPVVVPRFNGGIYQGMTHLTGGLPDEGNILKGTKRFKRWKGRVRSSGFVDLSEYGSGKIRMDNIYVIQLRKRPLRKR